MEKKNTYTRAEKIAAVKLVTEGGRTVPSVSNEYGIHENTLWKWKRQYGVNPEGAFTGEGGKSPGDEASRMQRRIRELENEVEFLKKVSAYFVKHPQ